MASFLLLWAFAVGVFRVPFTGSGFAFTLGALLYLAAATGIGLVMSSFTRTQVAAIFGTAILTIVPAVQFCGLTDPVSSLQGVGAFVGRIFPTTYFVTIARGTFSKGLGLGDLSEAFLPLLIAVPVLLALSTALLKKQAR
jgi:ribosome-dependent ATPase